MGTLASLYLVATRDSMSVWNFTELEQSKQTLEEAIQENKK